MPRLSAIAATVISVTAIAATTAQAAPDSYEQLGLRLQKSESVIRFFKHPDHKWLLATRKEKCWQVPWQRSCRIARHVFQKHWERATSLRARLFPPVPVGETQIRAWMEQRIGKTSADCLAAIINMENGSWDPTVDFGGGHGNVYEAYGLPQAYPGTKMASAGPDWRTNPKTQIEWMIGYTTERYGSPCGGWASRRDTGMY